ncbi:hypothetical protein KM043_016186 [Ampulex compressa]|nr:hypothetical protein KM043_016186 [Ampulex compressa]
MSMRLSSSGMLRCHRSSAELVRGLLSPVSRRSLSSASIKFKDEKGGGRNRGLISWFKDVFGKSTDDRSQKAPEAILGCGATTTVLDHPEITGFKQEAHMHPESSRKVKVINQKPTARDIAVPIVKFKKYRLDNIDMWNGKKISEGYFHYFIPHLGRHRNAAYHLQKNFYNQSYRRITSYPIKKDNFDKLGIHKYCPRCARYRYLHPMRINFMALSNYLKKKTYTAIRTFDTFVPSNTKPPIREPSMPQKRDKKDENKEKKKKKPVIYTEGGLNENQERIEDKYEPKENPAYRYEWGVKLPEGIIEMEDKENFVDKDSKYSTKQLWGVNVRQSKTDNESASSSIVEQTTSVAKDDLVDVSSRTNANEALDKFPTDSNIVSNRSTQRTDLDGLVSSSYEYEKSLKKALESTDALKEETNVLDEDYNIPNGISSDAEISAWKDLVLRSKISVDPSKEEFQSTNAGSQLEMVSIRPEPPQPKLDVQVVKSIDDALKGEDEQRTRNLEYKPVRSMEIKSTRKFDGNLSSKKLHTISFYIPYLNHTDVISAESNNGLFCLRHTSGSSVTDRNSSGPRSASPFPPNPSDMKTSAHEQNSLKAEAMDQNEEAYNNSLNISPSMDDTRPTLPSKPQPLTSSDQSHQVDFDTEFANNLNAIEDREMEISLSYTDPKDHEYAPRLPTSVTITAQPIRKQEADREPEHAHTDPENSYVNYDYVSSYEEDYYPGYEFTSLATPEGAPIERKRFAQRSVSKEAARKEARDQETIFDSGVDDDDKTSEGYITDGDYVRVAGDPYPYSREHFNKWRVARTKKTESVFNVAMKKHVGLPSHKNFPLESPSILDTSQADRQPPVRDMSNNSRVKEVKTAVDALGSKMKHVDHSGVRSIAWNETATARRFCISSLDQRVVPDCLRDVQKEKRKKDPQDSLKKTAKGNDQSSSSSFLFNSSNIDKFRVKSAIINHVETIQPDITPSKNDNPARHNKVFEVEKVSTLVQKPVLVEASTADETSETTTKNSEPTKIQELSSIDRRVLEKIYESKNYAYLLPEDNKNARAIVRSSTKEETRIIPSSQTNV